jgi:hypothetical protein
MSRAQRKAYVPVSIKRIQRGRNHAYTINGHKAVGVTTALSKGLPKPALMYWAARCVAEEAVELLNMSSEALSDWLALEDLEAPADLTNYLKKAPTRKRDDAAARGTKVHKIAEQLIFGDGADVPIDLIGHVESCVRFMDDWKVRPLLVEHTIGSYTWGYAGTFDLIAELPDGRRVLFDYKTGASGIWADTALQLAAYRYADAYVAPDGTEVPMKEVGVTEAKAVWVRADGYDVIPLATDGTVFKSFLHVLQVAKVMDAMEAWKGEAETPPWWKRPS